MEPLWPNLRVTDAPLDTPWESCCGELMKPVLLLAIVAATIPLLATAKLNCNDETGVICPGRFLLRSDLNVTDNCDSTGGASIRQEIQKQATHFINNEVKPHINEVLHQKYLGRQRQYPASNCTHLQDTNPNIQSGMYWLRNLMGTIFQAYCDFDIICDSSNRTGWMKIADFDLTDPIQESCPNDQFRLVEGVERYCIRTITGWGCNEHTYSVSSMPYTRVCGRATGLQIGGTDGFFDQYPDRAITVVYVDGVSLTYVNSSGATVALWTFAASYTDDVTTCPCSTNSINSSPSYVMNNYFCEAGAPSRNPDPIDNYVYFNDKLWDGMMCRSAESACCTGNFSLPWFIRDVGLQISDIKMRLCSDMGDVEEVGLTQLFLYIQ